MAELQHSLVIVLVVFLIEQYNLSDLSQYQIIQHIRI